MWWWRRVRHHSRWAVEGPGGPPPVEDCARDFALRPVDDGRLSIFAATDDAEADRVAYLYGLTLMGPDNLDYLLLPTEAFGLPGLSISRVQMPDILHPYLSDRHHEVSGLTPALTTQLVQAILARPGRRACRIRKRDLREAAPHLIDQDPTIRRFLHEEWEELL